MTNQVTVALPEPSRTLTHYDEDPSRGQTVVWPAGEFEACADTEDESVDIYVESRLVAGMDAETAERFAAGLLAAAARLRAHEAIKKETNQ